VTKSNLYSILCTSVRLAAVYLFVGAIVELATMVAETHTSVSTQGWMLAIGGPVIQALFALPLWMFPGPLARIAASKKSLEYFESDISPDTLQYLALSILGIWFVTTGVVQVAYTIHRWLFLDLYLSHHLSNPTADPKVLGTLLSEVVKITLGVALALGARGLVGLFRRFREAGLPRPIQADDTGKENS
jgi:hypothetical protein